jgi:hypothetical protein
MQTSDKSPVQRIGWRRFDQIEARVTLGRRDQCSRTAWDQITNGTISLPPDVKAMAEAEAARTGHSLDEHVARPILSPVDRPIDPATESELLKGLGSPAREFSAADFEAKKLRILRLRLREKSLIDELRNTPHFLIGN